MKRNFAKQLLCAAIALMLGIGMVGTVAAQEFVLPEGVKATPAQLKEIKTYYDKAPLLEKFFILTALPLSINHYDKLDAWGCCLESHQVEKEIESVWERCGELPNETDKQKRERRNQLRYSLYGFNVDKTLNCIELIKEHKTNGTRYSSYCSDTIIYNKGYIFLGGRALTYWKYGDAYLIATNCIIDGCCEARYHSMPTFFALKNNKLEQLQFNDVVRSISSADALPTIEWYDLYTFKEYIAISMSNDGCIYGWNYELPDVGKDIQVTSIRGCGTHSTDYTACYQWNGDGTFTKIGRADSLKKEIVKEYEIRGY